MRRGQINLNPRRTLAVAIAFCLLAPGSAGAEDIVLAPSALGPYNWVGANLGRANSGNYVPFLWDWELVSPDTFAIGEELSVSGRVDGEFLQLQIEATAEPRDIGDDIVESYGMEIHPNGIDLLIADYQGDQIIAYDRETGEMSTFFDGPELDGPYAIDCSTFQSSRGFGFGGGCGTPFAPPCGDVVDPTFCLVTSRENDKLLVLNGEGDLHDSDDVDDPRGVAWNSALMSNNGVYVARSSSVLRWLMAYDSFNERFILRKDRWSPAVVNSSGVPLEDVRGLIASGSGVFVANYGRDQVVSIADRSLSQQQTRVVFDADDGVDRPVDFGFSNPSRNPSARTVDALYLANETGTIYTFGHSDEWGVTSGLAITQGLVSQAPELGSLQNLVFAVNNRQAYALTYDAENGTTLLELPWVVGVTLSTQNAPADALIGVGRLSKYGTNFRHYMWTKNGQLSFAAYREEVLNIYVGRGHGAEEQEFTILVEQTDVPQLSQPAVSATASEIGGEIAVSITHDTEADEVRIYSYTGCAEPYYWGAQTVATYDCVGDPRLFGACPPTYSDPTEGAVEVLYPDLFDCFTQVDEIPANGSGTSALVLDSLVPGTEYCVVALAVDNAGDRVSTPSVLDFQTSCATARPGSRSGLFCGEALEAVASQIGDIVELPTAAPGTPTWYRYTAEGDSNEEHVVVAHIDSQAYGGGMSSVEVYRDACPLEGENPDITRERGVGLVVNGGDELFFRLSHRGRRSMAWSLTDTVSSPLSEQQAPVGLTASGSGAVPARDGKVTICWSPVNEAGVDLIDRDAIHYSVWSGEEGREADTLLADDWAGHCYTDTGLEPSARRQYQISALQPLNGAAPLAGSDDDIAVIRSELSSPIVGVTSAVDTTGLPPALDAPTGLRVDYPDPTLMSPLDPGFTYDTGNNRWWSQNQLVSIGTRVSWDKSNEPTRYRVRQTNVGTGETQDFVGYGLRTAFDVRSDMGLLCYQIFAERTEDDGSVTQSAPGGWSGSGEDEYCINMCTVAATELAVGYSPYTFQPHNRASGGYFSGAARYFALDFGENEYSGAFYTASFTPVPLRATAWYGSESCTDLVELGYSDSSVRAETRFDFSIPAGSGRTYVRWELAPDLFPSSLTNLPFLGEIPVRVEFGVGSSPTEPSWGPLTADTPSVGMTLDSQCPSQIEVEYTVTDWSPDAESFVAVLVDGTLAGMAKQMSGVIAAEVNPLISLHQVEVALFQDSLTKIENRFAYQRTGTGRGDVNGDCLVDVRDVVLIQLDVLGLQPLPDRYRDLGDYNEDGGIDILDLVAVVHHILSRLGS